MTESKTIVEVLGPLVEREGGAPEGWETAMAGFLERLGAWNRRINLVSRRTAGSALESHILPSLATLLLVRQGETSRVLDVGTGGGFPGIPLKILRPSVSLDLVEATRKKCRFLGTCVEELELADTRVHWCRIEEPSAGLLERTPFDLALARALGNEERLRDAVMPLLAPGGALWVFASPEGAEGPVWTDHRGEPVTALRRLG